MLKLALLKINIQASTILAVNIAFEKCCLLPPPPKWLDDIYAHAMTESFFVSVHINHCFINIPPASKQATDLLDL